MPLCGARSVPIWLTRLSTTHNHIGQLVSEPHHDYWVLRPKRWPASRGITHAISRFLQSCSNFRRMTCFWWQLTQNILIHTVDVQCSVCATRSWRGNEEAHNQKQTKRCMILFSPGPILTIPSEYDERKQGWFQGRLVVTWHTLRKMTFELFGFKPWAKVIDKPSQKDKTKCRGKCQQMVKCSRSWQTDVIFLAMSDLAEKVHVEDLIANRSATNKSYPFVFDLTVLFVLSLLLLGFIPGFQIRHWPSTINFLKGNSRMVTKIGKHQDRSVGRIQRSLFWSTKTRTNWRTS